MKAVYEAPYAIPELGVEAGDHIVVRLSHPSVPLAVVKRYSRSHLTALISNGKMSDLRPIHLDDSERVGSVTVS